MNFVGLVGLGLLLESERPVKSAPIYGTMARVTVPIREDGTGEIVFTIGGTRHVAAARTEDGRAIAKGTQRIAYVSTWER